MLTWPIRHARTTILIAVPCALLSILAVLRLHADAAIDAMLARNNDSTRALARVINDFEVADDLIVIASLPDSAAAPDPDRLLGFAGRLEKEIAGSKEASQQTSAIIYRADSQMMDFFRDVLAPSAVFYLDDASFAAAQRRLSYEQMRLQLEQDQAMLATPGPAAGALGKAFMADPLRLREFLLDRLQKQLPMKTYQGSDAFISEDGRALVIRVRGRKPPADLDFCKSFTQAISNVSERANSDALHLEFTGSYAIAAASAAAIRSDMIHSVVGSVICLQILFLLAYRRAIRLFVIALMPIALGVLIGFAGYALASPGVTPLAAVLGGVLAGMAIDYSIQYLSHFFARRSLGDDPTLAAESAVRLITPAAFAAWLTSIIGFAAIGASSVKMLRDFSILGTLGLAGAFAAVVLLLPCLLTLIDRPRAPSTEPIFRTSFAPLLGFIARWRRVCVGISAALFLGAFVALFWTRGPLLLLESDLSVMHPRPNPALDAEKHLAERFGISPDSIIVHLQSDSPEHLVSLAHAAERRLRENGSTADVSCISLATLLPDPAIVPARLAAIGPALADRVVADYQRALSDAGFNADSKPLQDYATFLRVLLTRTSVPTINDLIQYRGLAETMLPRSSLSGARQTSGELSSPSSGTPGEGGGGGRVEQGPSAQAAPTLALPRSTGGNEPSSNSRGGSRDIVPVTDSIMLVFPRGNQPGQNLFVQHIRSALGGLGGATPTGLSVAGYDTQSTIRHDLPRLILLAVGAVGLYLALHFRSVTGALLAMLPTLFSLTILLAAARLAGQKLNMVNLIAIPLLIGIDVDYGVFLVSLARSAKDSRESIGQRINRLAPVCHAVTICALATIIGFGSLAWTSVPAVRSLGFAVAVGIGACLFAALFLVVPIFLRVPNNDRR
ncbi:MAG TPA: MMPL family transporter [Humisphaera sp.]|jgi:hypothetical protein|nr:MMPL family transporter [Humisphaera sp.]